MSELRTDRPVVAVFTAAINPKPVYTRNERGDEIITVPARTLPGNVVMNSILYPRDEIRKIAESFNQTPATFGHPHALALSQKGLMDHYIFAHNTNARWVEEDDRVHMDIEINATKAEGLPDGKRVVDAIRAEQPISSSTGVLGRLTREDGTGGHAGKNWKYRLQAEKADHNAILLDEPPAASVTEGRTGLMVAHERDGLQVVCASAEDIEPVAVESALNRQDVEREDHPMSDDANKEAEGKVEDSAPDQESKVETASEAKTGDDTATLLKAQLDEMSGKMDKLIEINAAQAKQLEEKAAAEKDAAVQTLIKSGQISEGTDIADVPAEFLMHLASNTGAGEADKVPGDAEGKPESDDSDEGRDMFLNFKQDEEKANG